jgi:uncharacterized caspase-like protein
MRTWVAFCLLLAVTFSVHAQMRVALVFGNGAYEHAPVLRNPVRDARAISEALRVLGYDVQVVTDARKPAMEAALASFATSARRAQQALVFYSGHGLEVRGINYLLPVEARIVSESTVALEAVPLPAVMEVAAGARQLGLVVLDACRDNPLANSMERSDGTKGASRGLASVEPTGSNLLVAYATRNGRVAEDGQGDHSPYTTAILEALQVHGLEVRQLWGRVRNRVLATTNRAQEPFTYGTLGEEALYLNPPAASPPPPPQYDPRAGELAVWQSALRLGTADAYRDYLTQYPAGQFSTQAKLQIAALTSRPASGAAAPSTPAPKPQEPRPAASAAALTNWNAGWFIQFDEKSKAQACQRASEPDLKGSTVLQCSSFFGDGRPAFLVRLGPSKDRAALDMTRKRYLSRGVFSVILRNEDCSLLLPHAVDCASPSP